MGLALSIAFYACFFLFIAGYWLKMLSWSRQAPGYGTPGRSFSPVALFRTLGDIFFLRRLLRANDVLWLGEWIFHASLFIVFLRHFRYVLHPVPGIIAALDAPAAVAAWTLPASLIYIGVMKIAVEKKPYVSSYNFFLLGLLLAMSASGLVMKHVFTADLANVKHFTLGLVSFQAVPPPRSFTFLLHFLLFLVLLPSLPGHIFAAPLTMLEASHREEELPTLLHEK